MSRGLDLECMGGEPYLLGCWVMDPLRTGGGFFSPAPRVRVGGRGERGSRGTGTGGDRNGRRGPLTDVRGAPGWCRRGGSGKETSPRLQPLSDVLRLETSLRSGGPPPVRPLCYTSDR